MDCESGGEGLNGFLCENGRGPERVSLIHHRGEYRDIYQSSNSSDRPCLRIATKARGIGFKAAEITKHRVNCGETGESLAHSGPTDMGQAGQRLALGYGRIPACVSDDVSRGLGGHRFARAGSRSGGQGCELHHSSHRYRDICDTYLFRVAVTLPSFGAQAPYFSSHGIAADRGDCSLALADGEAFTATLVSPIFPRLVVAYDLGSTCRVVRSSRTGRLGKLLLHLLLQLLDQAFAGTIGSREQTTPDVGIAPEIISCLGVNHREKGGANWCVPS